MSRTLISFLFLGALFACHPALSPPAAAEELHEKFLDGLRQRRYYNTALDYLDELEKRTDLTPKFKQVIPYQRAITLLGESSTISNPEVREEKLDLAVAALEAFTRDNPNHELAGDANTQQARILIEKARVKIWESESPANKDNSEKFRLEGRALLTKARDTFQKAHDQHKATFEKFPKYIDEQKDKEQFAARGKAEIAYMRAQIDLALCTYEEAKTHAKTDPEFKNLLTKAADEFSKIHEKYRSIVGGLYSRMWQAKCFEEQDDIGKALGIYNELLSHQGKSSAMQTVQHQALQFRLICLNHEQRKDYQLVVNEAEAWVGKNRKLLGTRVGLGIRYEKALAHEQLADKLDAQFEKDLNEAQRNKTKEPIRPTPEIDGHLRKAQRDAEEVTKYSGQYKAPSQFLLSRIKGKLGKPDGPPETIEAALVQADQMRQRIEIYEAEVKAAKTQQEIKLAKENLESHLKDTAELLKLALKLATPETDLTLLNKVRFLLCFVYYKLEYNFEAGVIGEFLALHYAHNKDDTTGQLRELAQQGATVAMASYYQEYQEQTKLQAALPVEERDVRFELDQMIRVCIMTTELWPSSDLADQSRMTLGRIYSKREQPVDAAKWFTQIKSAQMMGTANVSAGQAYWNAYLNGAIQPEGKRPKPEDLTKWQSEARRLLIVGVGAMNDEVPVGASVDDATDLIAARVTLAQIYVNEAEYDIAIFFLTGNVDPAKKDTLPIKKELHHHPQEMVKVEEGQARPDRGVKSTNFARLVYQVLLRAYVGKQQTEQAIEQMGHLEKAVGEENAEELNRIYRELGEQIGKEVDRLRNEGDKQKLDRILASFDSFLNALYGNKDDKTTTDGMLRWMAETFLNLGLKLKGNDQAKATEYFGKSDACYESLLNRIDKDNPPKWETGMKLRYANASASAGNYQKGLESLEAVMNTVVPNQDPKKEPKATYKDAPDVQSAAAELLQKWGTSGEDEATKRLYEAIHGRKLDGQGKNDRNGIKGWGGLTVYYDQLLGPVRQSLRQLRSEEKTIIAYDAAVEELLQRTRNVENATPDELAAAEAKHQVLQDAHMATKNWMMLEEKRNKLREFTAPNYEQVADMEKYNRFIAHMFDPLYYVKLTSPEGTLTQERKAEIAELEKKPDDKANQKKIEQINKYLKEEAEEKVLLEPAYRTGQLVLKLREQLTMRYQTEYDLLKSQPNVAAKTLAELKAKLDGVRPANWDEKRVAALKPDLDTFPSKEELEKELKTLRNAITAWTAYELVRPQPKTAAKPNSKDDGKPAEDSEPEVTIPLADLTLDQAELKTALEEKRALLAEGLVAHEAQEAELYEKQMVVLYHLCECRFEYAKLQTSTPDKTKALELAERDTASLTNRIPRASISPKWWGDFNAMYKEIRTARKPLAKKGETVDPSLEIPVPTKIENEETWIERPSVTPVTKSDTEKGSQEEAADKDNKELSMIWVILGVLLALGGTGAAVYFMMGAQKKKPRRVSYGSGTLDGGGETFTFPAENTGATAAPKKAPGKRPVKKAPGKRPRPKPAPGDIAEAPPKAAPKKRPPSSGGEPPKPKPKPKPPE